MTGPKSTTAFRHQSARIFLGRFAIGLVALLIAIAVHWMAIGAKEGLHPAWETVGHWFGGSGVRGLLAVSVLAFLLLSWAAYGLRRFVTGPRLRTFALARQKPRPCLIVLVSSEDFRTGASRLEEILDASGNITGWTLDRQPYLDLAKLPPDPAERLVDAIGNCRATSFWPWQQLLRGLEPHAVSLDELWLVGSRGARGSFKLLPKCRRFLASLLGEKVTICIEYDGACSTSLTDAEAEQFKEEALDFEDFDSLLERLSSLPPLRERPSKVALDVTGGQKTTSIAGAAITLSSEAVFQYVQTSPPFHVHLYDAAWITPPHGHAH